MRIHTLMLILWCWVTMHYLNRDCLQTTSMDEFRVATDNIHDYTDTVSCYISWCTSLCVAPRIYKSKTMV